MKLLSALSICFLFYMTASAQNWQTINSNTQSIFLNGEPGGSVIVGLKANEVFLNGSDSIYYLYKNSAKYQYCFNVDPAIWAGDSVVIKPNGVNIYYPSEVTIHTQAQVNDNWQLLQFSNGDRIQATVTSAGQDMILGVMDSIKVIQLQVFDASNQPVGHALNGFELVISKNFGFVHTFDFRDLDEYPLSLYRPRPPTIREIYDFEVGDEIQIKTFVTISIPPKPFDDYYTTKMVTGKQLFNDSIVYSWLSGDTLIAKNLDSLFIKAMPQEGFITEVAPQFYSLNEVGYDTVCGGRVQIKISSDYYYSAHPDSCFNIVSLSYSGYSHGYSEGLGKTYYITQYDPGNYTTSKTETLQFYKKDSDSCGTRINTGIETFDLSQFQLYPNPATSSVIFSLPENYSEATLGIFNINGAMLISRKISSSQEIDVGALEPGMYIVKVKLRDQQITRKLVIQR